MTVCNGYRIEPVDSNSVCNHRRDNKSTARERGGEKTINLCLTELKYAGADITTESQFINKQYHDFSRIDNLE